MTYQTDGIIASIRDGFGRIGYEPELLQAHYRYSNFLAPQPVVREVELAAFAQQPPSFRNACFAVTRVGRVEASEVPAALANLRALGAPQVLTVEESGQAVGRWKMTAVGDPVLLEVIAPAQVLEVILAHRYDWSPEEVLRAKSIGARARHEQPDFFDIGLLPVLEREVHAKLDVLLHDVVASAQAAYRSTVERDLRVPEHKALFRLVFRLLAAKLLADRGHGPEWMDPSAERVIQAVNEFYFSDEEPESVLGDASVQQLAWNLIREGFQLHNLSVEALAYVYENTFVTSETREEYDTHATPYELAEYIVGRLPVEDLPQNDRTVFEPFCGHGPFLTAALGRLRALLAPGTDHRARHAYLVSMLSGMELDSFAREIARYSLILADYPNRNSWRVLDGDVFSATRFEAELRAANVVLANPPYGKFGAADRKKYRGLSASNKAAEAILRILREPPLMLGLLIPRTFLHGRAYREARQLLMRHYGQIVLTALPDNAFRFSGIETVAVMAFGSPRARPQVFRSAVAASEYQDFIRIGLTSWEEEESVDASDESALWVHPLHRPLREALATHDVLASLATIHRGVEYKNGQTSVHASDAPEEGFVAGLKVVEDGLEPYFVRAARYLDMRFEALKKKSHAKWPWGEPKVIANAARKSRGSWRMAAAVDRSGLVCSQRFHILWPKPGVSPELIAAILNGPVANAVLSLPGERDLLVNDVGSIPVPRFNAQQAERIAELVRSYKAERTRWLVESPDSLEPAKACAEFAAEIDQLVLAAYALPEELEERILSYMASGRRPAPLPLSDELIRRRHGWLVDKQFTDGIDEVEQRELEQLRAIMNREDRAHYQPMLDMLGELHAQLVNGRPE